MCHKPLLVMYRNHKWVVETARNNYHREWSKCHCTQMTHNIQMVTVDIVQPMITTFLLLEVRGSSLSNISPHLLPPQEIHIPVWCPGERMLLSVRNVLFFFFFSKFYAVTVVGIVYQVTGVRGISRPHTLYTLLITCVRLVLVFPFWMISFCHPKPNNGGNCPGTFHLPNIYSLKNSQNARDLVFQELLSKISSDPPDVLFLIGCSWLPTIF